MGDGHSSQSTVGSFKKTESENNSICDFFIRLYVKKVRLNKIFVITGNTFGKQFFLVFFTIISCYRLNGTYSVAYVAKHVRMLKVVLSAILGYVRG